MDLISLLRSQALGMGAIRSLLVFVVSSEANTLSSINRGEAALSSAEFFIKEGCRPDPTSWTLSFYHMNEAESASPNSMMQVVGHNEFLLLASL
jgi:hypothetical protein